MVEHAHAPSHPPRRRRDHRHGSRLSGQEPFRPLAPRRSLAAAGVEVAAARSVRYAARSVHLTLDDALAIAREAVAAAEGGDGVVVTTGTDTLEELAVLCDALNGAGAPIVLTGAIRPGVRRSAPTARRTWLDAVAVARRGARRHLRRLRRRDPRRARGAQDRLDLAARVLLPAERAGRVRRRGPRRPPRARAATGWGSRPSGSTSRSRSSRPASATTAACCAPRSPPRPTRSSSSRSAPATSPPPCSRRCGRRPARSPSASARSAASCCAPRTASRERGRPARHRRDRRRDALAAGGADAPAGRASGPGWAVAELRSLMACPP